MKIEKEIFPAGTDSRYFREVGMQLFYNLPMIYLGGFVLKYFLASSWYACCSRSRDREYNTDVIRVALV